jgi:hypothetical protein
MASFAAARLPPAPPPAPDAAPHATLPRELLAIVLGFAGGLRDYAALAKHVHDPDGEWRAADLDAALKARLRHTIW